MYASSDIQALLAKYGVFKQPPTNLPLLFVWGRESTVKFNGANVAFTELERVITDNTELEPMIAKKAFYVKQNEQGQDELEIWLELNENCELPTTDKMQQYAFYIFKELGKMNQDLLYQLDVLSEGTRLPIVRFFKRHESPISEASGSRKQVLVFQKHNLPNNYQLPKDDKMAAISMCKTAALTANTQTVRI